MPDMTEFDAKADAMIAESAKAGKKLTYLEAYTALEKADPEGMLAARGFRRAGPVPHAHAAPTTASAAPAASAPPRLSAAALAAFNARFDEAAIRHGLMPPPARAQAVATPARTAAPAAPRPQSSGKQSGATLDGAPVGDETVLALSQTALESWKGTGVQIPKRGILPDRVRLLLLDDGATDGLARTTVAKLKSFVSEVHGEGGLTAPIRQALADGTALAGGKKLVLPAGSSY